MIHLHPATSAAQGLRECNHCGECCRQPCLLGRGDLARMAEAHGTTPFEFAREHLTITKGRDGTISARPLLGFDGYCHFRKDGQCSVEHVKPAGGRDYACWDAATTAPQRERRFRIRQAEIGGR